MVRRTTMRSRKRTKRTKRVSRKRTKRTKRSRRKTKRKSRKTGRQHGGEEPVADDSPEGNIARSRDYCGSAKNKDLCNGRAPRSKGCEWSQDKCQKKEMSFLSKEGRGLWFLFKSEQAAWRKHRRDTGYI